MTVALPLNSETIRETFRAWNAERDSLDTQLSESLAALSAYQSHLDKCQAQLAREREQLNAERQQFEFDRSNADKSHTESFAALNTELTGAREKITALTTLLLNRTEELRTLDNRRAEGQTELELARARERELKAALEEHKQQFERERSELAEELRQLRDVLQRQLDSPVEEHAPAIAQVAQPATPPPAPSPKPSPPPAQTVAAKSSGSARVLPRESPVLGSIVEQFGKLRQQRATERQASNRSR
jgi:septal ring factor EnvC (AmiA/AmiB activator)